MQLKSLEFLLYRISLYRVRFPKLKISQYTISAIGPFQCLRSYWGLIEKDLHWLRHRLSAHLLVTRSFNGCTWASALTL